MNMHCYSVHTSIEAHIVHSVDECGLVNICYIRHFRSQCMCYKQKRTEEWEISYINYTTVQYKYHH